MNGQERKEEKEALEILRSLVSEEKYKDCIIRDKPDIHDINGKVGIEVVTACFEDEKKASSVIHSVIVSETEKTKPKYSHEKIGQILKPDGITKLMLDDKLSGFTNSVRLEESVEKLQTVISKKHDLLSDYQDFMEYELFVFVSWLDFLGDDDYCDKIKQVCNWYSALESTSKKYSKLLFCKKSFGGVILYDVIQHSFQIIRKNKGIN